MTGCSLCGRNRKEGESLSMRCVPKDPVTANKWREKFPFFTENMRVCESHFLKIDFENGKLKRTAVPLTRKELLTYSPDEIGKPFPDEIVEKKKPERQVIQCSVCKGGNKQSVTHKKPRKLHKIPVDPERAAKWFQVFPRIKLNSRSRICSEHFLDIDYENNSKENQLKAYAIPWTSEEISQYKKDCAEIKKLKLPANVKVACSPKKSAAIKGGSGKDDVCRACLDEHKFVGIPIDASMGTQTVAEMILFVVGIEIPQSDVHTQFVCTKCIVSLTAAYKFKEQFLESDNHFKSQMETEANFEYELLDVAKDDPGDPVDNQSEENEDEIDDAVQIEIEDDEQHLEDTSNAFRSTIEASDAEFLEEIDENCTENFKTEEDVTEVEFVEEVIEEFHDLQDLHHNSNSTLNIEIVDETYECLEELDETSIHDIEDSNLIEEYLEDPETIQEDSKMQTDDDEPGEKIAYKCLICNASFDHEKLRMEHLKLDHTKSELQCSQCGEIFRSAVSLNNHLFLHKNPKLFEHFKRNYDKDKVPAKMKPSPKAHFKTPVNNRSNISAKKSSPATAKGVSSRVREPRMSPLTYKCHICGDQFLNKSEKKQHLLLDHEGLSLTCHLCGTIKRTIAGLDEHLECHENPALLCHMCHFCSKLFRRACRLNEHIKVVHGSEMVKHKFSCDLCRFKAPFKVAMRNHIERVHLKILPFACTECPDRLFSNRSALLYHQGLYHGLITDHQCSLCQRYYPTKSHLKNHRVNCNGKITQSSAKPSSFYREQIDENTYRCKVCGKLFYGKAGRDKVPIHYSNMHRYACYICSRSFKNGTLLAEHLDKVHGRDDN